MACGSGAGVAEASAGRAVSRSDSISLWRCGRSFSRERNRAESSSVRSASRCNRVMTQTRRPSAIRTRKVVPMAELVVGLELVSCSLYSHAPGADKPTGDSLAGQIGYRTRPRNTTWRFYKLVAEKASRSQFDPTPPEGGTPNLADPRPTPFGVPASAGSWSEPPPK